MKGIGNKISSCGENPVKVLVIHIMNSETMMALQS